MRSERRAGGLPSSDVYNADLFVSTYRERVRYCPHLGGWLLRDGSRWRIDETDAIVGLATELAKHCYEEWCSAARGKEPWNWLRRINSSAGINAMLSLAKTNRDIVVTPAELDTAHTLLPTSNALIDLATGLPIEDSTDILFTKAAGTLYQEDASCPTWLRFMDVFTDGDKELERYIQKAVGYSLSGETTEQCFFFLYGLGCNGKSTFIAVLQKLLGSYAVGIPAKTLLDQRSDAIPNDLARTRGARVAVASEIPQDANLNEARVKDLTGGDIVTARFLHREYFDFRPTAKHWLYGNHRPRIRGYDPGIWRRIHCIPCDAKISDDQRDPDLLSKLERELPGVLNWGLAGFRLWANGGLGMPDSVRRSSSRYRREMDPIEAFLDSCTEKQADAEVKASRLYEAYIAWSERNKRSPLSQTQFGRLVCARPEVSKIRKSDGIKYRHLRLRAG
ncbi:DNA primase family protein [Lentisalinibacter sediminis]|uniref:DNA primase family protein n=1 Tax=Lentisalinibacter sediminis TaxID=2992237 RepID=UPI00386BBED1